MVTAYAKSEKEDFADRYGFSARTVQEWEQGRAQPDRAVRANLTVIARDPKAVEEALSAGLKVQGNPRSRVQPR